MNVWVESSRPRTLEAIAGNKAVMSKLKNCLLLDPPPHLLLTGPCGCGKTTVAKCLQQGHWFNASTELRTANSIFNRIRPLLLQQPTKIVLDEADGMLPEAQHALAACLESKTNSRTILTCNNLNKILLSLQSHFVILIFEPIDEESGVKALAMVSKQHQIHHVTKEALQAIFRSTKGDLRQAVHLLEQVSLNINNKKGSAVFRDDILRNLQWRGEWETTRIHLRSAFDELWNNNKKTALTLRSLLSALESYWRKGYTMTEFLDLLTQSFVEAYGGKETSTTEENNGYVSHLKILGEFAAREFAPASLIQSRALLINLFSLRKMDRE